MQIGLAFPGQHGFWEIGFSRLDDGTGEVFLWQAAAGFSTAEAAGKIRLLTEHERGAVVYQAQLPYQAFGVTAETLKRGFRFNLVINDNDGGERESFMRIAPGLAEYKQSDLFPCLMVVE